MQLELELSGVSVQIEIKGYTKEHRTEYGCTWCQVSFSFKSESWLNYEKYNNEVLTSEEVDVLAENLEQLLKGQIRSRVEVNFIEPDFQFILSKQEDGICADWRVHLWEKEKGLTGNYFSVRLYRSEIEKLWNYLNAIQHDFFE